VAGIIWFCLAFVVSPEIYNKYIGWGLLAYMIWGAAFAYSWALEEKRSGIHAFFTGFGGFAFPFALILIILQKHIK
jgi:hypothetical protein